MGYNPFSEPNAAKDSLRETFLHMEFRKLKRSSSGMYRNYPRTLLWIICYGITMASYLAYRFTIMYQSSEESGDSTDNRGTEVWKEIVLVCLLAITLTYASTKMNTLANGLTLLLFFVLGVGYFTLEEDYFKYILFSVLVALGLVWLFHVSYFYVGPLIMKKSSYCFGWRRVKSRVVKFQSPPESASAHDSVRSEGPDIREVVFEYRPVISTLFCASSYTFLYRGNWENGKPSGWGEWRDDSFYGESLVGYWKDGIPVGPFSSLERGTGNMFASVAIGYCSMRVPNKFTCVPSHEQAKHLTYGMAFVECAISGNFYKNFPSLQHHEKTFVRSKDSRNGVRKVLPLLTHADDNSILRSLFITATANGLQISGHKPERPEDRFSATINIELEEKIEQSADMFGMVDDSTPTQLSIQGWIPQTKHEILIFIHGYNISLDSALRKMAQFVSAGRFPPHIKPFVFSWPTGKVMFYFNSLEMISSKTTVESFSRFLDSIRESGVEDIHLITHSMGIRLFLESLLSPEILDHFESLPKRRSMSHLPSLENAPDSPLLSSEITSNRLNLATCTFLNPDFSVKEFRDEHYQTLRKYCNRISLYVDEGDNALLSASMFTRRLSLGRLSRPLYSSSEAKTLLDVDLIDISGLQDNMHSVRHSCFFVNRLMLEDLREVITERKRASYRLSRLVNKRGNLYCFMTTPAAVTSNYI